MSVRLYMLDGPLCATEEPGSLTTTVCSLCGRGQTRRTGILSVSLVCRPRRVWLTDGSAVLVTSDLDSSLRAMAPAGLHLVPSNGRWQETLPWAGNAVPTLLQVRSSQAVNASESSVELEDCVCRAVRRISFSPLIVKPPTGIEGAAIWYLAENPEILVFGELVRDALCAVESDLEFAEVFCEGEYSPPSRSFQGDDWSDL
jgi:hypothetical protein